MKAGKEEMKAVLTEKIQNSHQEMKTWMKSIQQHIQYVKQCIQEQIREVKEDVIELKGDIQVVKENIELNIDGMKGDLEKKWKEL